jgi:hypothetical protein
MLPALEHIRGWQPFESTGRRGGRIEPRLPTEQSPRTGPAVCVDVWQTARTTAILMAMVLDEHEVLTDVTCQTKLATRENVASMLVLQACSDGAYSSSGIPRS